MGEDIRKIKTDIRLEMKEKRRNMSEEHKAECDRKIFEKLKNLWAFRNSDTVLMYVSTSIEVDTSQIARLCFQIGKRVAVPRCTDKSGEMFFYYIDSFDELKKGHFGVPEPEDNRERLAQTDTGLCIVPALSFDRYGFRLGYGKGYYDRFLSGFHGETVGLCYDECITQKIPHGRYDREITTVVTDRRIIINR